MNKYYRIEIMVKVPNEDRKAVVNSLLEVIKKEWKHCEELTTWYHDELITEYETSGEGNISGITGEEDKAREIAYAIWEAYGKDFEIEIEMTCLENLPFESYSFDKEAFIRFKKNRG